MTSEDDLFLVGMDMNPHQAGSFLCDAFAEVPSARGTGYGDILKVVTVVEVGKKRGTSSEEYPSIVLVPIIDYGFESLAKSSAYPDVRAVVSPPNTIALCDDKFSMARFFRGMTSPFLLPDDADCTTFYSNFYSRYGKFVLKPRRGGRGSIDLLRVDASDEHMMADMLSGAYFFKHEKNFYAQEWIEGKEVTVDVFCDWDGKFLGCCPRERVEVKAGVSHRARIFKSKVYEEMVRFITETLKFVGPFNAQFIERSDGIYLIEINPRFSGGLNLSVAAGFNPVFALLDLVTNGKVNPAHFDFSEGWAYKHSEVLFSSESS